MNGAAAALAVCVVCRSNVCVHGRGRSGAEGHIDIQPDALNCYQLRKDFHDNT